MGKSIERLLVAEDDFLVRLVISGSLCDQGYEVIEVDNVDEAISIFRSGTSIDLLFTDLLMPGSMDSRDLVRMVRADYPPTRIILTSGDSVALRAAENCGHHASLPKPYWPEAVVKLIRSLLSKEIDELN